MLDALVNFKIDEDEKKAIPKFKSLVVDSKDIKDIAPERFL